MVVESKHRKVVHHAGISRVQVGFRMQTDSGHLFGYKDYGVVSKPLVMGSAPSITVQEVEESE